MAKKKKDPCAKVRSTAIRLRSHEEAHELAIVKAKADGASLRDIGKAAGKSHQTINNILTRWAPDTISEGTGEKETVTA